MADLDGLACLVAGTDRDVGGDLDLRTGILDGADQAGGGLRGFAHRDRRLLGGGDNSLVLPSIPRADVAVARVRSVRDLDWSVLERNSSATRRSNWVAFVPAVDAGGLDRFQQRDLRQDDVGFEELVRRWKASMHLLERALSHWQSVRTCRGMMRVGISLVAGNDVGGDGMCSRR